MSEREFTLTPVAELVGDHVVVLRIEGRRAPLVMLRERTSGQAAVKWALQQLRRGETVSEAFLVRLGGEQRIEVVGEQARRDLGDYWNVAGMP